VLDNNKSYEFVHLVSFIRFWGFC